MPWFNRLMGWGCAAVLAVAIAGCSDSGSQDATTAQPPTVIVDAALPVQQGDTVLGPRRFVGRVAAVSTVDISFQVGGRITALPIAEGQIVPAGTVIAELDKSDYELAVREAEVAFNLARQDLRRKSELARSNNVSQATLDNAQAEFDLRQVALDNARLNLSYTTIAAPFDALITRRLAEPQTNVQSGSPVLRIQDVSELRVEISVPEDLMRGPDDQDYYDFEAIVSGANGESYTFPLEFRENNTEPDAVTQTFTVTLGMPRPDEPNLLPGMTVTVVVNSRLFSGDGGVSVPVTAVVTQPDGGHIVWVYDAETGTVSARTVTLGPIVGERIVIESGLSQGEEVVAAGAQRIRDGMAVRLMRDREA